MTTDKPSPDINAVILGTPIFTLDGENVGAVKEVGSQVFKVNAPHQPDYWLAWSLVDSVGKNGVVLGFDHDQLGFYMLEQPEDALDPRRGRLKAEDLLREY
jgi:hypothetical protein